MRHNSTLNFTHESSDAALLGTYMPVRITRAGPNSLAGEASLNLGLLQQIST
jgi:hypothetical protein